MWDTVRRRSLRVLAEAALARAKRPRRRPGAGGLAADGVPVDPRSPSLLEGGAAAALSFED